MTTEEKAQRYDEISKEVKDFFDGKQKMYSDVEQTLNYLFPELAESKDEKIRKGIIDFLWKEKIFLQEAHSSVENNPKYRFVMDAIAWLEKHTYTQRDVDDAYLKGVTDTKNELEKQSEQKTLRENEDEKVRKEIIDYCHERLNTTYGALPNIKTIKRWLTWLEKQGEQKVPINDFKAKNWYVSEVDGKIHDMTYNPADKVEPKNMKDETEIPFGTKDSELTEVTYYIPKGFHAEIDDDKVVIKKGKKLAEWSEDDERIVTALMEGFRYHQLFNPRFGEVPNAEIISWIKSLKERLS